MAAARVEPLQLTCGQWILATIPQLQNELPPKQLSGLNAMLRQVVLTAYGQFEQAALETRADSRLPEHLKNALTFRANYEIFRNDRQFVSLGQTVYRFTGGAHGMSSLTATTVRISSGQAIGLADLFLPGSDYRERLDEYLTRLLEMAKQGAAALNRARTQQVDMATVKANIAEALNRLRQLAKREQTFTLIDLRPWLQQHGRKLALTVAAPIGAIVLLLLVNQLITSVSNSVALKPAQLTAVESLIQDSKNMGNTMTPPAVLTDNDLETMRVILQNRGISPNILRLNLDSGVGIEIQVDQAAFGQWVAFLEEIARRWQVYPTQLTLKATDQPETVSIRGTLLQAQTP